MVEGKGERWARIEAVLDRALELSMSEVPALLDEACGDDPDLRAEIETLLAADVEAEGFMATPAVEIATTLNDWQPPSDLLVGKQLGPYRVERQIGGGGMGVIYEAVDDRLDRRVALKLLPPAMSRSPAAKERFEREARAASALDHPNICTVHDIGETDDGRMFIVMAFYEGETLEAKLEAGPLAVAEARDLTVQIARGLERAHQAGIVHRDVKPANVIVTEHGEAKILDFGVAKIAGDAGLTRSGTSPGTPAYMSPEQSRGEGVDARSDIWSLAAVLYQMISGRRPFDGRNEMAIYMAIQSHQPKPLSWWRDGVPEAVERVVSKSLAKDPADRYQTVDALLQDLGPGMEETGAITVTVGAEGRTLPAGVVVRTLLMTDLVASTQLFEQLGDRRSAAWSAAHDRRMRNLLAARDGLEIDKTDGFFCLFERPIDAVACALAYHGEVTELSREYGLELGARAGLHLGEIHLRRNTPEDVARGAKPVEVEGLAKPLVARLTSLAGSGQTLSTQSTFDLARRAVDDRQLDEQVRWVAHGDYQLEGVPEPVGVFEIGVEGSAPLSAPADSDKARRAAAGAETVILGWRPAVGTSLPERRHWLMREKVGEGGFGEVWLAEHDKTGERRVFKFCYEAERLRSLEREVTLFRLMKDALGSRDDIVRILEWNFDQAPYYLESEYTEGGDLVAWAAARGGVTEVPMSTRIELVAQVAEALGAAHSVGILHKDVKPGNVLITTGLDGEPRIRLTDFGVGMVADRSLLPDSGVTVRGLTEDGSDSSAGTRLYLAPEILEGKVPSVQADLYAVGMLLYQMVVGDFRRALARGWHRDVEDEVLCDDIACFVDGAPERRPAGAQEIADRLRRLEDRREARRVRERERQEAENARIALELGRRRRRLLAAAVAVLLVFGLAMTLQVRRTLEEAARAEREAATAGRVSEFLQGLFEVVDPGEARGNSVTAREILDRGAREIEEELGDQPEIQARLMDVMGGVYSNLGLYQKSRSLTERSLEVRRRIHGAEHPEIAESLNELGRVLWLEGESERAETVLGEALAMRRVLLGDDHEDVAETLSELGNALVSSGRSEEAEALHQECLRIRRQRFEPPHDKIAEALFNLAISHHFRDTEAAEKLYQEALVMYRQLYGEVHPAVGDVLNNYGYLLKDRGDLAGAEPMLRQALGVQRQVLGADHHYVGVGESNLARVLNAKGEHAAAEPFARRAIEIFLGELGEDHWQTAVGRSVLGASLLGQGRFEEAEPLLRTSYPIIRERRGNDFNFARDALVSLVALYDRWDRAGESAAYRRLLDQLDSRARDSS